MSTPAELLAQYTNQSQMSSYFTDKLGILSILSYANGATIYDGTTSAYSALVSAIADVPTSGGTIVFPSTENGGTYVIDSNITVPANVTLWFVNGAKLYRTNSAVITLNCGINAGMYQILDDDGTGAWGGILKNIVSYPEWFCADESDYSTSIIKALTITMSIELTKETYYSGLIEISEPNKSMFTKVKSRVVLKNGANSSLLWARTAASNFSLKDIKFDGNKDNQTHTVNTGTPFVSNTALVMVQGDKPIVSGVEAVNTKLMGVLVSAYTDTSPMINSPRIDAVDVEDTYSAGIYVVFAKKPIITRSNVSKIGGNFVKLTAVNTGTLELTTETSFSHLVNTRIGVFEIINGVTTFKGSITKATNPSGVTTFTASNLTLYGGTGTLVYADNLYLLSAVGSGNGIITSNCDNAKIIDCHAEYTSKMGIGSVQDRGRNSIQLGCTVKCAGEESLAIDGCRAGQISTCNSEFASVNSNAPDIHIANDSPGITDPRLNKIIGCNATNGLGSTAINAGLVASVQSINTQIKGNGVYKSTSLTFVTNIGIQSSGRCKVSDNTLVNINNGINITGANESVVSNNDIIGTSASTSYGVRSNNAARTKILGNTIEGFTSATDVTDQGAFRIVGNTFYNCTYALDMHGVGKSATTFIGNSSHTTNLFNVSNGIPETVRDEVFRFYRLPTDIMVERSSYTTPITFTPSMTGEKTAYLRVIADGGYDYPADKIYRIIYWNQGSGPKYYIGLISAIQRDAAIIDVTATIDGTTGEITLTISGSGGARAIQYHYSPSMDSLQQAVG